MQPTEEQQQQWERQVSVRDFIVGLLTKPPLEPVAYDSTKVACQFPLWGVANPNQEFAEYGKMWAELWLSSLVACKGRVIEDVMFMDVGGEGSIRILLREPKAGSSSEVA